MQTLWRLMTFYRCDSLVITSLFCTKCYKSLLSVLQQYQTSANITATDDVILSIISELKKKRRFYVLVECFTPISNKNRHYSV